jgi:hypothetical protein
MKSARRNFLASVAAFALCIGAKHTGAQTALSAGHPIGPVAYQGDPNAIFSSIDTSDGIIVSRTSGQLPAFVHASAAAIVATGQVLDAAGNPISGAILRPYERMEYWWDFGDPLGTEIFTNPFTKLRVNANTEQYGPEAVYVYRTAGTKTITLHIRGKSVGGGYVTASVSTTFTAKVFNQDGGNWFFDSVSGNDNWDGRSPTYIGGRSGPKQSANSLLTIWGSGSLTNTAFHLAYGSSWSFDKNNLWFLQGRSVRIDAYQGSRPSSAKPQLIRSSGTHGAIFFGNLHGHTDVVLQNLDVQVTSNASEPPIGLVRADGQTVSDIYIDNCDCTANGNAALSLYSGIANQLKTQFVNGSVWGGTFRQDHGGAAGINFGMARFMSFVGATVHAIGQGNVYVHFINPEECQDHLLARWLSTSGSLMNFCIEPRANNWSGDYIGRWCCVSDCNYMDCMNGINFSNQHNASPATTEGYYEGVVVQRCFFGNLGQNAFYITGVTDITMRDNRIWVFGYTAIVPSFGSNNKGLANYIEACFYRNLIYKDAIQGDNDMPVIRLFPSGDPCTKMQEITDNVIYDARLGANAIIVGTVFADQVSSKSVIARNQYYAPNALNGSYFKDGSSSKTLAQWQAVSPPLYFDEDAIYGIPNWPDPSHGNFGAVPP